MINDPLSDNRALMECFTTHGGVFHARGREECRMRSGDTRLAAEGQGGAVTWEGRSPGASPDPGGTEREGARPSACRGGVLLMGWEGRAPATGARSLRWGALPPGM